MHLHRATLKAAPRSGKNLTAARKRHVKADTGGSLEKQPWLCEMQGQETRGTFRDCQVSNQPCLCICERGRLQIISARAFENASHGS